jgi:hypothetical protein
MNWAATKIASFHNRINMKINPLELGPSSETDGLSGLHKKNGRLYL